MVMEEIMAGWESFVTLLRSVPLLHLLVIAPFVLLWLALKRILEVDITKTRLRLRFSGRLGKGYER
jgi:hypothetical protein